MFLGGKGGGEDSAIWLGSIFHSAGQSQSDLILFLTTSLRTLRLDLGLLLLSSLLTDIPLTLTISCSPPSPSSSTISFTLFIISTLCCDPELCASLISSPVTPFFNNFFLLFFSALSSSGFQLLSVSESVDEAKNPNFFFLATGVE